METNHAPSTRPRLGAPIVRPTDRTTSTLNCSASPYACCRPTNKLSVLFAVHIDTGCSNIMDSTSARFSKLVSFTRSLSLRICIPSRTSKFHPSMMWILVTTDQTVKGYRIAQYYRKTAVAAPMIEGCQGSANYEILQNILYVEMKSDISLSFFTPIWMTPDEAHLR